MTNCIKEWEEEIRDLEVKNRVYDNLRYRDLRQLINGAKQREKEILELIKSWKKIEIADKGIEFAMNRAIEKYVEDLIKEIKEE